MQNRPEECQTPTHGTWSGAEWPSC